MRITLVFPPFYHASMYNLPPLGLLNLATVLQDSAHPVQVLDQVLAIRTGDLTMDADIYRQCAAHILATRPDLVAFSAQCTTYPPILRIARQLKAARPDLKIVVGGHNASFLDRPTLERYPEIDVVVRGEGEQTFRDLVDCWDIDADLGRVDGISWRQGDTIRVNPDRALLADLNNLPLPDYDLVPSLETYRQACELPRSIAILEVGRGCPHRCIYCSEAALWQRRTRTFAVERVVGEMQTLRDRFGAECFLLAYDQFTADRNYVTAFCQSVLDAGLQTTPWYCISRLDTVDADLLDLMRRAGCESMCYGVDSGSSRTLAFINKRIDQAILFERVRQTTDCGLVPTLSFVIGFPEEQRDDIDATLSLALACGIQGNSNPLMQLPTVLPGTELHRRYLPTLVRRVDTYFALGLEFDAGRRLTEDEQLIAADPEVFSSFWNLPCAGLPLEDLHDLAAGFPLIVTLFPKTFLLLGHSLQRSPSALFRDFAQAVTAAEGPNTALTPALVYRHIPPFARRQLAGMPPGRWTHLDDVLRYEEAALAVAQFAKGEKAANIDLHRLDQWRPVRPRNTRLETFGFDLPGIIADLKAGSHVATYPESPTWLVFRQQGSELDVTEVNAFGRDFLTLCDGRRSVAEIAAALSAEHAKTLDDADFLSVCTEAASMLADLDLLHSVDPPTQEGR